jgi:hypothetical protein
MLGAIGETSEAEECEKLAHSTASGATARKVRDVVSFKRVIL